MSGPILSSDCSTHLCSALSHISTTLYRRLSPLSRSESVMDVYESLTAAVYLMSSASNPLQVSKDARRQTFERGQWNLLSRSQTIDDMVESGFFFLQEDDHVKCFFCDLGLKDWDVGDVPEMEHAKFSPLCFFLKSSRGLDWLRGSSPRPPNYPTSYTRQDHNQLLSILSDEMQNSQCNIVSRLGFSETKVLLCVARKFIRFRQKFNGQELVTEMQKEWDREMSGEPEHFIGLFDLASVLKKFRPKVVRGCPTTTSCPINHQPQLHVVTEPENTLQTPSPSSVTNRCKICELREVELWCRPCGHLSLCQQCGVSARICPADGCGLRVDRTERVYEQGE